MTTSRFLYIKHIIQLLLTSPPNMAILTADFVAIAYVQQQRQNINSDCAQLITPHETVYPVIDRQMQNKLGLSAWTE